MDVDVRHLCVYVGGCVCATCMCTCRVSVPVCKCAWRAVWCVSAHMCSLGQGWAGCQGCWQDLGGWNLGG